MPSGCRDGMPGRSRGVEFCCPRSLGSEALSYGSIAWRANVLNPAVALTQRHRLSSCFGTPRTKNKPHRVTRPGPVRGQPGQSHAYRPGRKKSPTTPDTPSSHSPSASRRHPAARIRTSRQNGSEPRTETECGLVSSSLRERLGRGPGAPCPTRTAGAGQM